ncbi:trans-aconitate 2-methyltransferase [Actinokineospora sp. NBRC 105648]|uniref:trans-aconitate 2-methyltransferase n=1 Tax=Actinokineospora sp. NBRC 105648 TaxID=3032206 RepID=UPI0024A4A6D4|nr:trans-aconitate 2-methyltransferase [Actinokineospora sp. NBRC 105648]GLZ39582.1 trans-aconitate 2-methyltransferase [Actinokineospora sp. NBRC 105648]
MWDPAKYLSFGDHRARPFFDLLARVRAESPRAVVDLGCGPGNLTVTMAQRWPNARLSAIDTSAAMVSAARQRGVDASVADLREWVPDDGTDVVISNAALQWVPGHPELLAQWAGHLPRRAWIGVQVPGNFAAPSHALVRELVAEPGWFERLEPLRLREEDAILEPEGYAELMIGAGCEVDVWETTYLQRLDGEDAVLEWVSGTALRPIRAELADEEWQEFRSALAPRLAKAYPRRADGTTWFPFRRVFFVARTR